MEAQAFYGLDRNLTKIDLNDNKIEVVDTDFKDLHVLKYLNLDRNPINKFAASALPQTLEHIYLSKTELSVIPEDMFFGVRGLQTVIISDNMQLAKINPEAFDRMGRVIPTVDLSNNHLGALRENTLEWQNITKLDLADNPWNYDCNLEWTKTVIPDLTQQMV